MSPTDTSGVTEAADAVTTFLGSIRLFDKVAVPSIVVNPPVALEVLAKAVATPVPKPLTPVAIGRPVALVRVPDVGVPNIGVTKVGEVANTAEPVPVSSVKAPSNWAEVNDPSTVALPDEVTAPVKLALVVTLPAVKPEAVPVMLVPTKADGVPKAGVTNVGEVANTKAPEPVSSVTAAAKLADEGVPKKVATPAPKLVIPVPPLATGNVPVTPVVKGRPVAFVSVTLVGVPRIGVTSVGLVAKTREPVPVSSVTAVARLAEDGVPRNVAIPVPKLVMPVPPLATASVPATVTAPEVAVAGVSPVVPKEIVSTPSTTVVAIFTKSEPFQAAKHFSAATIVTPAVGPTPRNTTEPVPALMTI